MCLSSTQPSSCDASSRPSCSRSELDDPVRSCVQAFQLPELLTPLLARQGLADRSAWFRPSSRLALIAVSVGRRVYILH